MHSTSTSEGLPFPPVTKQHILNCAVPAWHSRYRRLTPKTRLVSLSSPFLDYLRADGIILPPDPSPRRPFTQDGSVTDDGGRPPDSEADEFEDPSSPWSETHENIIATIESLGGRVTPKLNWSAPKDATWINPTNSLECRSANDVYMMLKSSDFITHDLEHAFSGCSPNSSAQDDQINVNYHLMLRKWVSGWNPSVEFRCFVRQRMLIGLCQRDLNYYEFLFQLRPTILNLVKDFFSKELQHTFPDENFVFDIYVPHPYKRVWMVDINPWAIRTDSILFSWKELLDMDDPIENSFGLDGIDENEAQLEEDIARLSLPRIDSASGTDDMDLTSTSPSSSCSSSSSQASPQKLQTTPTLELRLIRKSDPEAYAFNTPQYSAHKFPKDVVDASSGNYDNEQLKDFSEKWVQLVEKGRDFQRQGDDDQDDSEGG